MSKSETLSIKVLRKSKGQKVKNGSTLLTWYDGTFINGDRFDANYDFQTFSEPIPTFSYFQFDQEFIVESRPFSAFEFVIGGGTVIQGWDKAFSSGRRVGEVIELYVPWEFAYGETGTESGSIPPMTDLKFKIEILGTLPENETLPNFASLKDVGINTKKIGLKKSDITNIQSTKIGLDGQDRLIGDNTNDLLVGLKGHDRLFGAAGADRLIGGKGKNQFIYTHKSDSPDRKGERDIVFGFQIKKDKFNFRALGSDFTYIEDQPFSGVAGEIKLQNENLSIDLDGDKMIDLAIELPGVQSLSDSNFHL
jgi:Ca2+-binding RTX toxin-like protein